MSTFIQGKESIPLCAIGKSIPENGTRSLQRARNWQTGNVSGVVLHTARSASQHIQGTNTPSTSRPPTSTMMQAMKIRNLPVYALLAIGVTTVNGTSSPNGLSRSFVIGNSSSKHIAYKRVPGICSRYTRDSFFCLDYSVCGQSVHSLN